jgi:hypothetical protein
MPGVHEWIAPVHCAGALQPGPRRVIPVFLLSSVVVSKGVAPGIGPLGSLPMQRISNAYGPQA